MKVMIVDSEPTIVRKFILKEGLENVVWASDPFTACRCLRDDSFDLLVVVEDELGHKETFSSQFKKHQVVEGSLGPVPLGLWLANDNPPSGMVREWQSESYLETIL